MWSLFTRDPLREFQYEIFEEYCVDLESLFRLHRGKSKVSGNEVSIFIYEKSGNVDGLNGARTTVKRLKTLRHRSILTYIDSYETDNHIYLVTESVKPLISTLDEYEGGSKKHFYFSWGIMQVIRAVSFMNKDAKLRHNNIFIGAVFVNSAGEWKVGEVCYCTGLDEPYPNKLKSSLSRYIPPEILNNICTNNSRSTDSWGLGLLIWETFNGRMKTKSELQHIRKIPKSLVGLYCELVSADHLQRPDVDQIIMSCTKSGGYFNNPLVNTLIFLEEIQIKEKHEKVQFFNNLVPLIDSFPENLCKSIFLQHLLNAFEFGEAGVSVLTSLIKVGSMIDVSDFEKLIAPCIAKLFISNDRATRCKLLQEMNTYIEKIPPEVVNQKIFPLIAHGFLDSNPIIRELTVKSIVDLAPKLNYNNLNVEVLKHFARIQSKDDQSGIRTNTTVCLGKIAPYIHSQVRQKVLLSAFLRALNDPFPPARVSGILALVVCQQFFKLEDVAERVLPALSKLTLDVELPVRVNVFRAMKGFLGKLEKVSENPTLKTEMEGEVISSSIGEKRESSWAEWAVAAISLKFRSSTEEKKTSKSNTVSILSAQAPVAGSFDIMLNSPNEDAEGNWIYKFENEDDDFNSTSEGWDVEGWAELEEKPELEIKGHSSGYDSKEEDLVLAIEERKFEKNKKSQDMKETERAKRQSAPLKLGTKIS